MLENQMQFHLVRFAKIWPTRPAGLFRKIMPYSAARNLSWSTSLSLLHHAFFQYDVRIGRGFTSGHDIGSGFCFFIKGKTF